MKTGRFTTGIVGLCARLAFALAALLFLAPLTIGQALGSNCESSYRISHSNSDCMHAWWDNSPSSSCWGTKGGAQIFCSNYGEVVGKVDIISGTDITVWLRNPSKWRYTRCANDTRQISCCIDKSELCKKSQVEMNDDGKIEHYHSSNNTWSTPLVNTPETVRALRKLSHLNSLRGRSPGRRVHRADALRRRTVYRGPLLVVLGWQRCRRQLPKRKHVFRRFGCLQSALHGNGGLPGGRWHHAHLVDRDPSSVRYGRNEVLRRRRD